MEGLEHLQKDISNYLNIKHINHSFEFNKMKNSLLVKLEGSKNLLEIGFIDVCGFTLSVILKEKFFNDPLISSIYYEVEEIVNLINDKYYKMSDDHLKKFNFEKEQFLKILSFDDFKPLIKSMKVSKYNIRVDLKEFNDKPSYFIVSYAPSIKSWDYHSINMMEDSHIKEEFYDIFQYITTSIDSFNERSISLNL